MKIIRQMGIWALGAITLFPASAKLVRAAEVNDGPATPTQMEAVSQPTQVFQQTLPASTPEEFNTSMAQLRDQYGEDTAARLVLEINDGTLQVVGLKTDDGMFLANPSCF